MQICVGWTTLLVPALALWAVIGLNTARSEAMRPWMDSIYFLVMILIAVLTWRTMSANDPCWLIHTTSLGTLIVFGVLPKRDPIDEAVHLA